MSDQTELACVSCETTFDPAPNGGFCPDCDTPHPDFEMDAGDADDEPSESESSTSDDDTSADAISDWADDSPSYCPDCGTDIAAAIADDGDDAGDADACPDCGRAVTDESYCPDCGTDLDAARDEAADDAEVDEEAEADDADDAAKDDQSDADDGAEETADDADDSDAEPASVTLTFEGESYSFGDGDTFGRQDEDWLEALVEASGGSDDVAYISSEHLTFSVDEDTVSVEDTSRNGTKLNGTDLDGDESELEDGDTLELAERAEITVEL